MATIRTSAPSWRSSRSLIVLSLGLCVLVGSSADAAVSFNKRTLQGTSLVAPTSVQFGPDGRLYVAQQSGTILA